MTETLKRLSLPIFILILAGLGFLARDIEVSTDISFFMPGTPLEREQSLLGQFSDADGIAMIALDGRNAEAVKSGREALTKNLRAMLEVADVSGGGLQIDNKLRQFVIDNRFVLGPSPKEDAYTAEALENSVADGVKRLGFTPGFSYRDIFPRDPTGRLFELARAYKDFVGAGAADEKKDGADTGDAKSAVLFAILNAKADDTEAHARVRETIEKTVRDVRGKPAGSGDEAVLRAEVSGPGFFVLDAADKIRGEMQFLTTVIVVGVAVLLLAAFRTPVALIVIGLPVGFGIVIGIFATALLFGQVHGVAITFGAVMAGVAVDYPIHLMSFRRSGEPPAAAAGRLFPRMLLGAATTFAGFVILSQSSFQGLAQIGLLSAVAISVAVLFSRFLLPGCLPKRLLARGFGAVVWPALQRRLPLRKAGRLVIWAVPVVCGAFAFFNAQKVWDDDIRSLNIATDQRKELDETLRSTLKLPDRNHFVRIDGDSAEAVLEAQWRLSEKLREAKERGEVGGYLSVTDVLPPASAQRARLDRIPDEAELKNRLSEAVKYLPPTVDTFAPFIDDTKAAKKKGPVTLQEMASVLGTLPLELPKKTARGWTGSVRLYPPFDGAKAAAAEVAGASYIDLPVVATEIVERYRHEGMVLILMGLVAGFAVLGVGTRSLRRSLRTLATPAVAVAATAALLVALGTPLNFFHLLAFVLVISIGIDYEVFFAGYSEGPAEGGDSFGSVMLCFLTTFVAFSLLGTSELPLLQALGTTVAIGAAISFLLTVLRVD